ncbi:MAG: PAS domain-containing protein [Calditrichaeota bacterium]|nr:PAS domain-containing protein [Calditrichota bacterium]
MKRKRLLWQLFPSYLVITLGALLVVGWIATSTVNRFYISKTKEDLEIRAHLIVEQLCAEFTVANTTQLDSICKKLSQKSSTRITFINDNGLVIGDSEREPATMENHGDRPEIRKALSGEVGISIRFSTTLEMKMMYLALPLSPEKDNPTGVVRVAIPLTTIRDALSQAYSGIILGGLFALLLAAMFSYIVSRKISNPLVKMKSGAERFASGELGHRLETPSVEEFNALAVSLNKMAADLDFRIGTVTKQRNELEAVLSSMVEGVIAVDMSEKLLRVNLAAQKLLGIDSGDWQGRSLIEMIRNQKLQEFVADVLNKKGMLESELFIRDQFLQTHGTLLYDENSREFGALIVLNDITRLRKLEKIRKEFAANVSHELRTPITSIKGFAETLRDGALEDKESTERFLDIIIKHSDRLTAIIEDLLSLSRIEQDTENERLKPADHKICEVVESAVQLCESKIGSREVDVIIRCVDDPEIPIIFSLLERGIVNLLDNAINYSEPGSSVDISIEKQNSEVVISVKDSGCGIAEEYLPRLFERFFRVDADRSRKMGGTGLGLAIVKHAALAHNGSVSVESEPGQGSTFRINLPVG